MQQALNRMRIALGCADMTDAELLALAVAIAALAPTSSLIAIPAIAASVGAVATKAAAFKSADDAVKQDEEKLRTDRTVKLTSRGVYENELNSLAGLVGTNAKNAADVASMALKLRGSPVVATGALLAPEQIDVQAPKKGHGRTKVSVHEIGTSRGRYVAEWSPDPIGPTTWAPLPGTGKSRTITGQTGTKVWVRFARVRAQLQSDWSVPVLVNIP